MHWLDESNMQNIVEQLMALDPDSIPRFVLLKEWKGLKCGDPQYEAAYAQVLQHPLFQKIAEEQTADGYWGAYHGDTEAVIRQLLWMGVDPKHPVLQKVARFTERVLQGEDIWHQRCEKHDTERWWLEMFMPLVSAAMLSLLDPHHPLVRQHAEVWREFVLAAFAHGEYDPLAETAAQYGYFKIKTKRTIPFYNYYCVLLLSSQKGILPPDIERKVFEYCLHREAGMYYIYDKNPSCLVPISDTKNSYHWLRNLSIIARFSVWDEYKDSYYDWVWQQRTLDGLWDLGNKPRGFLQLSDSWRQRKNRIIDSSVYVLRFLANYAGY